MGENDGLHDFYFCSKYFLLENNIKLCFFNGFLMILMDWYQNKYI
jgi:hypothetical protein